MRSVYLAFRLLIGLAVLSGISLLIPRPSLAQKKPAKKPAVKKAETEKDKAIKAPPIPVKPLNVIGIRPGISMDSVQQILKAAGASAREVTQDTLTRCFADQSLKIYVVDSIIIRLSYMRLSLLVEKSTNRVRRFTITPRLSSILGNQDDDLEPVLLLYFGQLWGKPDINLDPPLPFFRWRSGNIETRGFIKRGYPLWVMEG